MKAFKPDVPYTVPAVLKIPDTIKVKGVAKKVYKDAGLIYVSFRTFGGTETQSNGQLIVEDTGTVETWFRPDIKSDCVLEIGGTLYEILGTPENVAMRNMWIICKVKAVKGGA